MEVTAGIFLASILLKEMRYLVYIRYLWAESTRSEFTQSCDEWKRGFVVKGSTSHFNILQEWAIHCEINRDAGTIKRQRGANAHQRAPRSIDTGEDINLQLCVDLPMKANALNQVTFKITPHDFAQKTSLEM